MAKKKVTTTVEEVDVDDTKVNYDDIHKKDMSEVVSDVEKQALDDKKNAVEKKAEELKEQPKEEKKEEEKKEEVAVNDPEKIKKEAAAEAKKEILDALQGKDAKETEQNKDEYEEWRKKVFTETGKNPSWSEAADFIKEKAKREIKEEQEAVQKRETEEKERSIKAEEAKNKALSDFIDQEIGELIKEGKIPKVVNKDDANDAGVIAQKALLKTMYDLNEQRKGEGKPTEYSIYKVFHQHYKSPTKQPAGADAPVSAGTKSGTNGAEPEDKVRYSDLKKPWGQFMRDLK